MTRLVPMLRELIPINRAGIACLIIIPLGVKRFNDNFMASILFDNLNEKAPGKGLGNAL